MAGPVLQTSKCINAFRRYGRLKVSFVVILAETETPSDKQVSFAAQSGATAAATVYNEVIDPQHLPSIFNTNSAANTCPVSMILAHIAAGI